MLGENMSEVASIHLDQQLLDNLCKHDRINENTGNFLSLVHEAEIFINERVNTDELQNTERFANDELSQRTLIQNQNNGRLTEARIFINEDRDMDANKLSQIRVRNTKSTLNSFRPKAPADGNEQDLPITPSQVSSEAESSDSDEASFD